MLPGGQAHLRSLSCCCVKEASLLAHPGALLDRTMDCACSPTLQRLLPHPLQVLVLKQQVQDRLSSSTAASASPKLQQQQQQQQGQGCQKDPLPLVPKELLLPGCEQYVASPDEQEENLLILLHGLGDRPVGERLHLLMLAPTHWATQWRGEGRGECVRGWNTEFREAYLCRCMLAWRLLACGAEGAAALRDRA